MSGIYQEIEQYQKFTAPAEVHKAVNSLIGMLKGIRFDEQLNNYELSEVLNWCNLHRKFQNKFPFSEIIPMIDAALEDELLTPEEIKDIQWLCENVVHHDGFNTYYDIVTSSLQQLHGVIHGIMADNQINEKEINMLFNWMNNHDFLNGFYPFDEIYSLIVTIKQDGVISNDEINMLKAYLGNFIDTRTSYNINESEIKSLQEEYTVSGICMVSPNISFEGMTFSFTGKSSRAKRNEIANIIIGFGGIFNNNVTQNTNFLIVGDEGNPCWAFSCYGRKVEKAIDLRKKGHSIILVHENDFWQEHDNYFNREKSEQ